ncbi:sporulation integral membrane protein YtvI [Barrientosiimonas marina]|uniref:Sporulation integral membrane protein YtvI n=1 Tax=Lentibacillus kimchii TaxID=1542911 RepID=A0ABW2UY44_9BACI
MYKKRMYQLLRSGIVLTAIIAVGMLIHYTAVYIYPFLAAAILVFCLNPVVSYLENRLNMPRGLASFSVLFITIASFIGLMIIFISELVHGTSYLAEAIPKHIQSFMSLVEDLINQYLLPLYQNVTSFFQTLNPEQQESITNTIHQLIQQFASLGSDMLNYVLTQLSHALASLPGSVTFLLFTILGAYFIMKDWHLLLAQSKRIVPRSLFEANTRVWYHLRKIFTGYIKAQLLLITLTAVTALTGLLILQIDYALTITLLTALADILPFIGAGLIFMPWIIYLFLTGDYSLTIGLTILYMIIAVQRQALEPKLVSDGIGSNPLVTLVTLFIALQVWGAFGLLIGPLLVIIGAAFYQAGVLHQAFHFIKGS